MIPLPSILTNIASSALSAVLAAVREPLAYLAEWAFVFFVLVWLVSMLRCAGHRRLAREVSRQLRDEAQASPLPISVVIIAENQCHLLRERLHLFLDQNHPDFEVVVVDKNSQDETLSYLETLSSFPNLQVRALPSASRDISVEQLALTLGILTASREWVLLTDITCQPSSPDWLRLVSSHCGPGKDIVLGYTAYRNPHGWAGMRYCFFRVWQQMLNLTHATRRYTYRAEPTNLCLRKTFFLEHKGFAAATQLRLGAVDVLVNTYSTPLNTSLCLLPRAFMLQDCPRGSSPWTLRRLFFMETRRHLPRRFSYRLRYALSVALTWLFTLSLLASLVFSLWLTPVPHPLVISTLFLWFVHLVWRSNCINGTFRVLCEPRLYLSLPLMLHLIPKWDIAAWLHHRFAPRGLFRKRFV